jgi:hypothetical protein
MATGVRSAGDGYALAVSRLNIPDLVDLEAVAVAERVPLLCRVVICANLPP